jgi:hypothetical protein
MSLDAGERELVADVIGSVRTLAAQMLTLHLHLGALRSLLVEKGILTEAEFSAAVAALEASSTADAIMSHDAPTVDEAFENLLRRLDRLR